MEGRRERSGNSLKAVFFDKSSLKWDFRADIGRTSPSDGQYLEGGVKLSRAGPQVLQHPGQQVTVRIPRGQVHPDAPAGFPDAAPDLQELEPQGVDLGRGQLRALKVKPQQPK